MRRSCRCAVGSSRCVADSPLAPNGTEAPTWLAASVDWQAAAAARQGVAAAQQAAAAAWQARLWRRTGRRPRSRLTRKCAVCLHGVRSFTVRSRFPTRRELCWPDSRNSCNYCPGFHEGALCLHGVRSFAVRSQRFSRVGPNHPNSYISLFKITFWEINRTLNMEQEKSRVERFRHLDGAR